MLLLSLENRLWEMPFSPVGSLSVCKQAFRVLGNFGCSQEILSIAAMMQIQNVFVCSSMLRCS